MFPLVPPMPSEERTCMTAIVIDIDGLLKIGAQLRADLRSIAEEPLPPELLELAAELDRAIEVQNKGGAANNQNQGDD